ncbi:hypothetical protein ACOMHN_015409 [Nucella lapillus]
MIDTSGPALLQQVVTMHMVSRGEPGGHTDPDPALSAAGAGHVCAVACLMVDPTQTYLTNTLRRCESGPSQAD